MNARDYFDDIEGFFVRVWTAFHFVAFGAVAFAFWSRCGSGVAAQEQLVFAGVAGTALLLLLLDFAVLCKARKNIEKFTTYLVFLFWIVYSSTMLLGGSVGAYLTIVAGEKLLGGCGADTEVAFNLAGLIVNIPTTLAAVASALAAAAAHRHAVPR